MSKRTKRQEPEDDRYADRGINTLLDGYQSKQYKEIGQYFMKEKNDVKGCRDRSVFMFGHALISKSETTLPARLADLSSITIPNIGQNGCMGMVVIFERTKRATTIRHRRPENCAIGALSFNFFSRFHFENKPFPDFSAPENWHETLLFPSKDPLVPISYSTHREICLDAFKANRVFSSKVTQTNRRSALNMMAVEGVAIEQQRIACEWIEIREGDDDYSLGLPIKALKALSSFSHEGSYGDYFVPRADVMPSQELQQMVFPKIEYWLNRIDANDVTKSDKTAPMFLKLLKELRIVFLQDSVVLKKKYPSYYLWTSEIFETDLYKNFEALALPLIEMSDALHYASRDIEMAMRFPHMYGSIPITLRKLTDKLNAIQETNFANTQDRAQTLQNKLSSFFALGSAIFNKTPLPSDTIPTTRLVPSSSSTSVAVPSTPSALPPPPAQSSSQASTSTTIPQYTMKRNIDTVTDLWREYDEGLDGPSVRTLESSYKTGWRKSEKESRHFCRRREIYVAIEKKANDEGISNKEAAAKLEQARKDMKLSLDQLRKKIKLEKKTDF